MPRAGWLFLVLVASAGGAVASIPRPPAGAVARAAVEFIPAADPFPIRRVRGTDARLPDLLKELEPGPVVRLPRAEFESRARAAGRAASLGKHAARVVDATYAAELIDSELTGTAELGVLNAHGVTGFAPLDPLRLAVRDAKWADGREAVLAAPAGAGAPAVWVDRAGRDVLRLDWSLAGTSEPGERRFELRVPHCPASTLELNLPADQVPAAASDALVTGPFEVPGKPGRRRWVLRFGGRPKLEFAVRAAGAPGGVARARLAARYDIAPGQLTATLEYELAPARGSVGEWAFTADPGLRITDVATNNRAGWSVDPPAAPGGPRRVRVTLRQPGAGGKVVISAVAPFPDPARAGDALPTVRPLGAVLDEERLEVRVASSLKPEAWSAGDYRLTDAAPLVSLPLGASESFRAFSLVGTLLPPGADEPFRRMPSLRVAAGPPEFATFERLEWQLDPARSALVARLEVRVRRGPLFQLAVRPPPGFTLDRAASGPDELVSYIAAPVGGAQVVEFARPLAGGERAELRLEFRGPGAAPGAAAPLPALGVVGAAERDGWLAIACPPQWSLATRAGAGARPGGLWGWLTADAPDDARAMFLFRGREPEGSATLLVAPARLTAEALVRVDAPGDRWSATTRLTVNVTGGAIPALAAVLPREQQPRSWKLLDERNAVAEATPVPGELLSLSPALGPLVGGRTLWVLRFARPLIGPAVIETTAAGGELSAGATALPVPVILGATQAARAEVAPSARNRVVAVVNGNTVFPVLRHASQVLAVSDAYLVTLVRSPGDVLAACGGTVRGESPGGTVQLFLPREAEVRGVCVAGRWLNPAACEARDDSGALVIPVPAGPAVRFEARYRLPVPPGWPTRRVFSPVPDVGGGTPPFKRWWVFAAGVLPGWPARPWDATAESPPLLGGPLGGGADALVTRSDDEWVRAGPARTADAVAAGLAGLLAAGGLVAARRRRARGAVALAGAVVIALLVAELGPPWWARAAWPPLVAATLALGVVLAALAARRGTSAVPAVKVTAATATATLPWLLFHALAAVAQPAAPATVLIVTDAEGREEVVASRATMARLEAAARPAPPAPMVASAEYDVRVDEGGARVTARLVAHAFRPHGNVLTLPLGDARLEGVAVGGKPAFPTASRPDAYAVALPGPGRHEVELRFAAAVTATGPEREVSFGVPESPRARLSASLPGGARQPHAVGRLGRQTASTGGDRAALEADLGAVRSVHLRWREGAGGAAVVKVREACIWDVAEAGADLTAAYLVRVEQGAVAGMRFDVPAELEVMRVAARSLDAPGGAIPLRDWSLAPGKGGTPLLRIDFQNPAGGRLVVVLQCAPRRPITRQPVLRFPRVNFGGAVGETEAVYGLRASRVAIDNVGLGGVGPFPPDALRNFAAVADLRLDPNTPVSTFQPVRGPVPGPTPGAVAELRPSLRVVEPPAVRTSTAWHVGPHRADAAGTVSWAAKEAPPLLEFTIPGVKVAEVRGPEVAGWSQSGTRVQVWLRAGAREGVIEWAGGATPAPPGKPHPLPLPFEASHPRIAGARAAVEELRVRPVDGWQLRVDRARGWHALSAAPGELHFRSDSPGAPEVRVQLAPARSGRADEK